MRKITTIAALATVAIGVTGGVSYADQASQPQSVQVHTLEQRQDAGQTVDANGVHYTLERDGDSIVLTAADGSFDTVDGTLLVHDAAGNAVDALPLSYRKDDVAYGIDASLDAGTVRLTPATAGGAPVEHPITAQDIAQAQHIESFTPRDQQELGAFSQRASIASTVGAVIGAIVGGGLGCVAGAIVGSVSTAITTLLAGVLPGAVVGCIAGVAAIGAVGTLAGAALVAGPVVLWSAYQYFTTITAPCTGPGAYCVDPAAPKPADAK
ncbi:hypothetical protein [Nocardia sp. alder85J]|uniref:hypothetical protein n=1 Tax=Nocardia sp. alder85J TaxID=2862949 RepID=UPI001CD23FCC|nr:hypothetical protein [Nocardia sp. alder85J]MCX4096932.1 hypothetical protein [Nocardia sp. alder85J]